MGMCSFGLVVWIAEILGAYSYKEHFGIRGYRSMYESIYQNYSLFVMSE